MSTKQIYCCDAPLCDNQTDNPARDEWIEVDGAIRSYQGVREGQEPPAQIPYNEIAGFKHYCSLGCLDSALSFPENIEGEDASAEVGPCPDPQ